jgi:hypothetical protein
MEASKRTALANKKDLWRERVSIVEDSALELVIAHGKLWTALPLHAVLGRLGHNIVNLANCHGTPKDRFRR